MATKNYQWLWQTISQSAYASMADAQIIVAVNALRQPNQPIPIQTLTPLLMQSQTWANLEYLRANPSTEPATAQVAVFSALSLVTGSLGSVDITLPSVQNAMRMLASTNMPGTTTPIMSAADQTAILELAQPLLVVLNGWSSTGIVEADLTAARNVGANQKMANQCANGYNACMALIEASQSNGSTPPTASTLNSTFASYVVG